eukprot:gene13558-14956_t
MRQSSSYKKYAKSIPKFLDNRPTKLIKHWMERSSQIERSTPTQISIECCGKFSVGRLARNVLCQDYEVWFGDANSLPSCRCYDWTSSPYLCKHFQAVFKKYPLWSWEALSPQYRESPFFKLDEEFSIKNTNTNLASEDDNGELPIESMTNDIQEEVVNEQKNHTSNDEANDLKQSPTEAEAKERLPPKNIASMCREVTNEIRNASFLLESEQNVLMEAYDMLKKVRDKLLQACPKKKGLPLLNEANMVKNNTTSANLKLQLLPARKRKGPLTNWIGEKKERYDIAKKIKVVPEQEPEPDIQEEFVAMNDEVCEGEQFTVLLEDKVTKNQAVVKEAHHSSHEETDISIYTVANAEEQERLFKDLLRPFLSYHTFLLFKKVSGQM